MNYSFSHIKLLLTLLVVIVCVSCNFGTNESNFQPKSNSQNLDRITQSDKKSSILNNNLNNSSESGNLISWPQIGIFNNDNNIVSFCHQSSFPLIESKSCFSQIQLPNHPIDLKINSVGESHYLYYVSQNPSQIMMCLINEHTESFIGSDCTNALLTPSDIPINNVLLHIVFNNNNGYILGRNGIYRCQIDSAGKISNCILDFNKSSPGDLVINGDNAYITAGDVGVNRGVYHCEVDNNGSLNACNTIAPVILPGYLSNPQGLDLEFGNLYIANNINIDNSSMPQVLKCQLSIRDGSFTNNDCRELPIIKQSGVSLSQVVTTVMASDGVIIDIAGHDDINGGQIRTQCYLTPNGDVCLGSNPVILPPKSTSPLAGPIPPNPESGFFNIIDFAMESNVTWSNLQTGGNTICATIKDPITKQSVLHCWGNGTSGQLGPIGYGLKSAYPIAIDNKYFNNDIMDKYTVGYGHLCAAGLDQSGLRGKLYCWGENVYSQSGISKTGNSDYILIKPNKIDLPIEASTYTINTIVAGGHHTCMILVGQSKRLTYCLGSNNHGQLGIGSRTSLTDVPTLVNGNLEFENLSAGYSHTCGIDINHNAWCFGSNYYGQLGSGLTLDSINPVKVISGAGDSNWLSISAGRDHTCALDKTGRAFCFGDNENGQLGNGTTLNSNIPVAVQTNLRFAQLVTGDNFSCGLSEDNQVYCWGFGGLGEIGNGTDKTLNTLPEQVILPLKQMVDKPQLNSTEQVIKIRAGNLHACALTNLGHIYCWGINTYYQLGKSSIRYEEYPSLTQEVILNVAFANTIIACSSVVLTIAYYETRLWWVQQRINAANNQLRALGPRNIGNPNIGNQNICQGI